MKNSPNDRRPPNRLYVCRKCKKPKPGKVKGKAMKGKKLIKALREEDLAFEVIPCKCLGQCKKGPNAIAMPGRERIHRLSLKKARKLSG